MRVGSRGSKWRFLIQLPGYWLPTFVEEIVVPLAAKFCAWEFFPKAHINPAPQAPIYFLSSSHYYNSFCLKELEMFLLCYNWSLVDTTSILITPEEAEVLSWEHWMFWDQVQQPTGSLTLVLQPTNLSLLWLLYSFFNWTFSIMIFPLTGTLCHYNFGGSCK